MKINRRDELKKNQLINAENWAYQMFPRFQKGDIVYTYQSPDVGLVVEKQFLTNIITEEGESFHLLNVKYFILDA